MTVLINIVVIRVTIYLQVILKMTFLKSNLHWHIFFRELQHNIIYRKHDLMIMKIFK